MKLPYTPLNKSKLFLGFAHNLNSADRNQNANFITTKSILNNLFFGFYKESATCKNANNN